MESAAYPPYYGGSTPFYAGATSPASQPRFIPRGQGDWAQNFAGVGGLGRLGQVGAVGGDWLITASTLAGAAVGGGLVGWVASKRGRDAAKRGAAFSTGLTAVADGFGSWKQSPVKGAVLVGGGLAGLWWVLRKF